VSRRTAEAWDRGASEVCLQGGIHPDFTGNLPPHLLPEHYLVTVQISLLVRAKSQGHLAKRSISLLPPSYLPRSKLSAFCNLKLSGGTSRFNNLFCWHF